MLNDYENEYCYSWFWHSCCVDVVIAVLLDVAVVVIVSVVGKVVGLVISVVAVVVVAKVFMLPYCHFQNYFYIN